MVIHVVTEGDTVSSIASAYGVSESQIITQNELPNPDALISGQNIVIQVPTNVHTVADGDTLASIATQYGTTAIELLRNNPPLTFDSLLTPGQSIYISYDNEKIGSMSVNGYAYPFISEDVLKRTLPYLTTITIFTYGFTPEAALIPIDDAKVLSLAKEYGVRPIMLLSTLSPEGTFSNVLANTLLTSETLQDTLITAIIENMKAKGYYALDVDFEFIYPEDAQAYVAFIQKLTSRLNPEGLQVMVALAPKISSTQTGTLYEGHDYAALGAAANTVLLMTYEWGYTYGPPMAVSPINKVREVLDYGVSVIPANKINMGVPNYGYDWPLPYVKGTTVAQSLGNVQAVERAIQNNVPILYDNEQQAPYYNYEAADGIAHEVWFEDARSIDAKLRLVPEYNFIGVAYWNLMKYFPANWLVLNGLFNINRIEE